MSAQIVPLRRRAQPPIWAHLAMLVVGPVLFVAIVGTLALAAAAQAIADACE